MIEKHAKNNVRWIVIKYEGRWRFEPVTFLQKM